IIGAPIACSEGIKDSWREIAQWVASKLYPQFGNTVQVKYYDLFDSDCPPMSPEAQLPFVLVDEKLLSSGGKISLPLIRCTLEKLIAEERQTE
ncbi:MAG: hypothetical protein K8I82_05030, partial [Anaerolineae bacterium]|nr:hypothetical protein [Anaerolineae bacterium]